MKTKQAKTNGVTPTVARPSIKDITIDSDEQGDMITIAGPLANEIRATGIDPRQFVLEAVSSCLVRELEDRVNHFEKLCAVVR